MGNLTSRLPWRRASQEDIDLWRVYQLLYYREQCGGEMTQVKGIGEKVPLIVQRKVVNDGVVAQIVNCFGQEIEELVEGKSSFPKFDLCVNPISERDPIPGVNLKGQAFPGSVICFFPGLVYRPIHVPFMPNYPHISSHNPYLMAATNGCIVDAKDHYCQSNGVNNQYSRGHLVRHPSPNTLPNIMPYTLVLTHDDPLFSSFIPNRYFDVQGGHDSSSSSRQQQSAATTDLLTIVFIALRHIKDEELLLNYRLHPDSKLPEWYTSVDNKEDKRRWKEINHFKK